jgi:hypothetical protein
LQDYIKKGKTDQLPDEIVIYMELLEMVRSMYSKYETKVFIIKTLLSAPYNLSRYRAHNLFADALNFFYTDNKVKQKAWESIYAQHLDNLAYYALELDDIEGARRCFMDAAKMRGAGKPDKEEIPAEFFNRPVVIYTMDAEKAGLPTTERKSLAAFIDNIPEITERERVRLKKDAGVQEFELFEDYQDAETTTKS